jgi:cytochrome c553
MLRVLGGLAVAVVLVLGGAIGWLALRKPAQRPASTEAVARTPERLARGKFLAEDLCGCMDCHSEHREDLYSWPAKPETYGQGGFTFDEKLGIPGHVCAQNITPDPETGIGNWTDGEILRAMREGVAKDGRALFPMMPYPMLRAMSDEDARSIVVYLRSLKPIRKQTPEVRLDFPANLLVKLVPRPLAGPVQAPAPSDGVAYGKYLATLAGCVDCHTKHKNGKLVEGMEFAGGWELRMPWGRVVPPNITPEPETGIGNLTRDSFVGRFKAFASLDELPPAPKGRNTIMNWRSYGKLSEADLGAIYDYLRTVKSIKNKVNPYPDAS